jgi:hypothetical protein
MHLERIGLIIVLAFTVHSQYAQLPSQVDLSPYTLDYEHHTDSDADVGFLVDAPAGKDGFLRVENGHIVKPDGKRFRMWGVTMSGWTDGSMLIPTKDEAELTAKTLRRLGVNAVRYMFLDFPAKQVGYSASHAMSYTGTASDRPKGLVDQTPEGLIDTSGGTTSVMSPEMFERLDYFVAQLKKNGIYINFNLNVDRRYTAGDNVHGFDLIGVGKAITYFDPRLVELQKDYARQLLTHYNPYTKSEYRNEPDIAVVQIANENSVLEFWQRNWMRGDLKPDAPTFQLDMTPFHKQLLTQQYNDWLKRTYTAVQRDHLRHLAGVESGEPLQLTQRQNFTRTPDELFYAEINFLTHVESSFMEDMNSYLKTRLGTKSLIVGTNDHTYFIPGMPLLRTQQKMDMIDAHVYWEHPAIYGDRNTPMVNDPLHSIAVKLTRSVMSGKPFVVSEYNEPYPSHYGEEVIPIIAAYGALQDWDGIFIYCFAPQHEFIHDYFDITQNPVMIAQMPVGALMFVRHDIESARHTIERTYSTRQVNESTRLPEAEDPYYTPGFPLSLALEHASRIRCIDCTRTSIFTDKAQNPIRSDTGQLAWWNSEEKGGLVSVDTDRTSALIGFVKSNKGVTSHLAPQVQNEFCAITLSSLDGEPISTASKLLVTTTGRVENTGSVWNPRHTMFEEWGAAPTRIEPIRGWLLLKQIEGAVGMIVTPLDGAGRPLGEIRGRRVEAGWEIAIGDPVTTTYLVHVIR